MEINKGFNSTRNQSIIWKVQEGDNVMGIERQGSKPTGRIGRLIGMLMNGIHTNIYISYFDNKLPPNNSVIMDIGCGGGRFIKYLSGKNRTTSLLESIIHRRWSTFQEGY